MSPPLDEPGVHVNELTIEQLAAESGMSVRNIRAHQARGLLDPPEVRARVGYYGAEHLAQLRLIRDLQDDGFNLAAIKRLLEDPPGMNAHLLRFQRALTASGRPERAETLSLGELIARFRIGAEEASAVLGKAAALGILVPVGEQEYEASSPSLLAAAEGVMRSGISLLAALTMLEQIQGHADAISASFVGLFVAEVWRPFEDAGMPDARWQEIEAAIERLRPLAAQALQAVFEERMSAQVREAFGGLTRTLQETPR